MTQEQADYLMSLPLVNHVPHLHFFVVHAGLLPSDPRLPPTHPSQPLAHAPALTQQSSTVPDEATSILASRLRAHLLAQDLASDVFAALKPSPADSSAIEDLRRLQESAILSDVPQNRDPWVVVNMRSVTKKHKATRKDDKGTPWSKLWNKQMDACKGYEVDARRRPKGGDYELPCHPTTIVYGHAASRGLDVKRWSMGLDTGCLYGQQLTALVLNNSTNLAGSDDAWFDDDEDEQDDEGEWDDDEDWEEDGDDEDGDATNTRPKKKPKRLQFGDPGSTIEAKIISIKCPNLDDDDED